MRLNLLTKSLAPIPFLRFVVKASIRKGAMFSR
jgi:hypothetical protein